MSEFAFREPVSAWTHGAWMLLCIPAGIILQLQARRCPLKHIGFAVFTISLITCFLGSWLYHSVNLPIESVEVDFCARLDYMGIFLLIAGTTTPVVLVVMHGWWRLGMLLGIWTMAGTGILIRALAVPLPDEVSTALYIFMGWTGILCYFELARRVSHRQVRPLWVGGLLYSIGAVLNTVQWPQLWPGVFGPHELFHVFVMSASLCHFTFMYRVVARFERMETRRLARTHLAPEPAPA
jgi:hemolysin III